MDINSGWELIDSGGLGRLERFGDRVLARPSSLAIWNRSTAESRWRSADATYDPDRGWQVRSGLTEEWDAKFNGLTLKLRLQRNGQVGLFPEHATYLSDAIANAKRISSTKDASIKVLNLFAYTGMASVVLALAGAEVTHVEIQKSAIGWAEKNIELNNPIAGKIRFICEDAIAFVEREVRRGNRYDMVIADPPSFSRASKSQSWDLDDVLGRLVAGVAKLLVSDQGACYLTMHHQLGAQVLANLFRESSEFKQATVECRQLVLLESSERRFGIPAGELMAASW